MPRARGAGSVTSRLSFWKAVETSARTGELRLIEEMSEQRRLTGPSSGYSSGPSMSVESTNRNKPFKITNFPKYGRSTSVTRPSMSSEQSGLTTDQGLFSDTRSQLRTASQSRISSSPSGNEPHLRLTQQIPYPIGPPSLYSSGGRSSSQKTRLTHSIESILSSSGSVQHKRQGTQQSIAEEAEGSCSISNSSIFNLT